MPSPQTGGKLSTALPWPAPVAQGVFSGCWHAEKSLLPVAARVKKSPLPPVTGLVAVTVIVASAWKSSPAASVTPPAVMVMATVFESTIEHVLTPGSLGVQLTNVSVPGSSLTHAESTQASFTVVVPLRVAGTVFELGGGVLLLVLLTVTTRSIVWLITSVES